MKAFVYREYGSPDVLKLEEIPKPVPAASEVLVQIRAAAANPLDYHFMKGLLVMRLMTGLRRPKRITCGVDFSGVIESVGTSVLNLKPGDEVFGSAHGAFAEYLCAEEGKVAIKGSAMSFEEAAGIPVAAMTALQALRDKGSVTAGQKILVNGAAGGVGSYAVQIAKSMGAEVTAVCSTRNIELMLQIGADHVIDYSKEDFTDAGIEYDMVFDAVGNHRVGKLLSVLKPTGRLLNIGVRPGGRLVGPVPRLLKLLWLSWFAKKKIVFMVGNVNPTDLGVMRTMIEEGKVKPLIDSVYRFEDTALALAHLVEGHVRGKVIVAM